jgi:hypothetical protein
VLNVCLNERSLVNRYSSGILLFIVEYAEG